jgi:hypothetical protein
LECCPRDWRNSRWRRGHHHPRCRVREGLVPYTNAFALSLLCGRVLREQAGVSILVARTIALKGAIRGKGRRLLGSILEIDPFLAHIWTHKWTIVGLTRVFALNANCEQLTDQSRLVCRLNTTPPQIALDLHTAEARRPKRSLLTATLPTTTHPRSLRFNGRRQASMGCALPFVKPNAC